MQKCLTITDLDQFHRGDLDAVAADSVRDHLCGCRECAKAYREHSRTLAGSGPATASISPDMTTITPSQPQRPALTPTIDGYRIIGVLGQGGMGIVYRAVQNKLNRTVALKVLPAIIGSANPQAVSRFRREATAAASLHHTNIIPIYDFGESKDAYYYAMELITGQPLDVLVDTMMRMNAPVASTPKLGELLNTVSDAAATIVDESGPNLMDFSLPTATLDRSVDAVAPESAPKSRSTVKRSYFSEVARWVADAADALHYAHNEGIIHRDIKPANLILSEDGRIMIADFGLAKSQSDASVTMTGSLVGTLRYISPEQAQARRVPVDHRTDIYSLGATMYELLTFQPAYPGTDDKQILGAILSRDPRLPRKLVPRVPGELETICMKMIERSPDARYATAGDVADDLRRFMDDLPIVAKRPSLLARGRKFVKRHRAAVISVTALVLLVGATAFSIYAQKKRIIAQVNGLVSEAITRQVLRNYDEAALYLRRALQRDPTHFRAMSNLAIVLKEQFNASSDPDEVLLEEANSLCARALRQESGPQQPSMIAGVWNIKGIILKKLERYDESISAYESALEYADKAEAAEPSSKVPKVPWWGNLGVVQVLNGDIEQAMETLKHATELTGTSAGCNEKIWRHLAALQLFREDASALETVDQSLRCKPSDAWSAMMRVRCHLEIPELVDADEAVVDARVADRLLLGQDPEAKRLLAWAYLRNGEYSSAAQAAEDAATLNSTSVMVPLIRAIAAAHDGRADQARAFLEQAEAVWPDDLRADTDARVTAEAGVLWIENADSILALRAEAREELRKNTTSESPDSERK